MRYKSEGVAKGLSMQAFCSMNNIPYNAFEKYLKLRRHFSTAHKINITDIPEKESGLNTAQEYWINSEPTDMRKGRDSLASIVRERFGKDPRMGPRAFIFYSKDLRKVKILHYSLTGYEIYIKWFDNGKCLRPVFSKIAKTHTITRSQLLLLLTGAVRKDLRIN